MLTPILLKTGLRWAETAEHTEAIKEGLHLGQSTRVAIVIGIGPVGQRVALQLRHMEWDVWLIDQSPVNLHDPAQQGFRTIAGDATDDATLEAAHANEAGFMAVCVPGALREQNPTGVIVFRCRYTTNERILRQMGANRVVSEEAQASDAMHRILVDIEQSEEANRHFVS